MVSIKIGDYDVYDSGRLVNVEGKNVEIKISTELSLIFEFITDKVNTDTRVEPTNGKQPKSLVFKFINYNNNVFGTGNGSMVRIGWLDGRSLLLSYRIFSIVNNNGCIIDYTLLLGKKVDEKGNEIDNI